jgi:tetratricopeptide (TPR) repeat protein
MKKLTPVHLSVAIWSTLGIVHEANAATTPACQAIYEQAQRNPAIKTPLERARHLETTAAHCMGSGMFDVWVASEYLEGGDNERADAIARKALKQQRDAHPNLSIAIAQSEMNRGNLGAAEKRASETARDHPNYAPAQYLLMGIAAAKGDWKRALVHAERTHSLQPNALSLLGLATIYHQLDRHTETVDCVYRALKLEPQRIAKGTGVIEAIFSLAILNRRAEAAELARRHIAANPEWQRNNMFARAAYELGVVK